MEHFWRHGYEATSVSDLTTAMGIAPASLYAAFGSKEELFREAVTRYNAADASPTDHALTQPGSARDAIEALLRDNADAYVDPATPRGCMVVLSGLNLSTHNAQVDQWLTELREEDHRKIRDRLAVAVEDGELPTDCNLDHLAAYLQTVLQGLAVQARDGCSRQTAHAIIDHALVAWDHLTGPPPHR